MSSQMRRSEGGSGNVHRTFLGWDRPVLHSAADTLIASAGEEGPIDLREAVVVLPGTRAGQRLVELLLDRSEAAKRPLVPPRMVSTGGLPERLYRPRLPAPGEALDRFAWVRALREADRRRLETVFPDLAEDAGATAFFALAGTLRSLHDQVGGAGYDFSGVADACRGSLLFNDELRWKVLAGVQVRYRKLLAQHGFQDRDQARMEALAEGRITAPPALWVVGATDLPTVTRRFLKAASHLVPVQVLVAAPPTLASHFDAMGAVIPEAWAAEGAELAESSIQVVPGPDAQADAVLTRLARVAADHSADAITVGVPDPEVIPYVVERLREVEVVVRYAGGRRMEETAPFRLLAAIAEYLESREFDRFAALLRHPDLERWLRRTSPGTPSASASLADRYHSLHLPFDVGTEARLPSGGEQTSAPLEPGLRRVRDLLDGLLAPLHGLRSLSEWSPRIRGLLIELYGDKPLERHAPGEAELLELAEALRPFLEGIAGLPGALELRVPGHEALRFGLEALRGGAVPEGQDEAAVELLGWLELALDDAPVLVVTGANEPHLPASVTADPFLPHGLLESLGMLDNAGRWARDLAHLRTMVETRSEFLVIAGRRDAAGNPLRLSRLLLSEAPDVVANRLLAFLDPTRSTDGARSEVPQAMGDLVEQDPPEASLAVRLPPEMEIAAPAPPGEISVTAFRRILKDPYLYALESIRRLSVEDDRARELDGAGFGTLAHEVLEDFGRGAAADSDDPARIREALFDLLATEESRRFGTRPLPAVRLQVEQLRFRLRAFAEWQADWVRAGWRMRAVEATPGARGVAFSVDDQPILLRGKVDRVDEHQVSGEWCVLDYKTSDRARTPEEAHRAGPKKKRRWVDLQLPLYHLLVPALRSPTGEALVPESRVADVRVGYIVLPRDQSEVGDRLAAWSASELEEAHEMARLVVRFLRQNRFSYRREGSQIRQDEPLAAVVGGGVLRLDEEGEDDG